MMQNLILLPANEITAEIWDINLKEKWDDLTGYIVLIESADPGYDWLFSHNISGLITKHGGVASHMAIRCAEFNLPAAIGCGESLYKKIKQTKTINLDCLARKIDML